MLRLLSIGLVGALCLAYAGASTSGTSFLVGFMANTVERPQDLGVDLFVENVGASAVTVTVSAPRLECATQTDVVNPGQISNFTMCYWLRQTSLDTWPTYKTILVEATGNVRVLGVNKETFSADGFYAIPINELAYTYYVTGYTPVNLATQFSILASTVGTACEITIPNQSANGRPIRADYQGRVYRNGNAFRIALDQYETYYSSSLGDLSGTKISCTEQVAVFSGNIRAKEGTESRDHLTAQLAATGDWGTSFFCLSTPRLSFFGDKLRIIGLEANTTVTIRETTNNPRELRVNEGEVVDTDIDQATSISSTRPIQVTQIVRSQAGAGVESTEFIDPALYYLPSRDQWMTSYRTPVQYISEKAGVSGHYTRNYIYLAVATTDRLAIRIDGVSISPSWSVVDGVSLVFVSVTANTVHTVTTTNGVRFMAGILAAGDRESVGMILAADYSNSNCQLRLPSRGDGFDNDCDGFTDEENCNNLLDDDNDGLINEDCSTASVEAFGNDYMVMYQENNVDDNGNAVSLLEMYAAAVANEPVNYAIQTKDGWVNGSIGAGVVGIINSTELPQDLRHNGNGISDRGISVTADRDIVLYAINKQTFSTDAFLCFPTSIVGTEYYTAHFWPGEDLNQFAVAAISSGTSVTITMPTITDGDGNVVPSNGVFQGVTYGSGATFTFTLNRAQTAQIQGASPNDNLNGARVQASSPVSLFSGNVRARVQPQPPRSSRDHLVQQLPPTETWGTVFITIPTPRESDRGDVFTITARFANTDVTVRYRALDGSDFANTYNIAREGGNIQLDIPSRVSTSITSGERPIMVIQYVKTSLNSNDRADPAMTLIPPVEQWSNNYKFVTPLSGQLGDNGEYLPYTYNIMVAIERTARDGLRLNGDPIAGLVWTDVPTTTKSTTNFVVDFNRHSLTNTDGSINFMALMYGAGDRESFSLPIGLRLQAQACVRIEQVPGDRADNDCDGNIDEELCNGIDDDGDTLIDEDCSSGDSSGTMFYLAYMDNQVERPKDFKLNLFVASVETSSESTVTVRAPLWPSPEYNSVTRLEPQGVQEYSFLPQMRMTSGTVEGKGISVTSTGSSVVYAVNKEKFSTDAFLVFPATNLGTTYYTMSWSPSTLPTEFAVVGTTVTPAQVTITPRLAGLNAFTITLERYQTYQMENADDLSGTRIDSTQRVAVFSGNIRTRVQLSGSRDHLVEQMIDVNQYGTTFPLIPTPERSVGDYYKVVGNGNGGICNAAGLSIGLSQGAPQLFERASDQVGFLSCNGVSVMVNQFVKSQDGPDNPERADPAMTLVPSLTNFISQATFVTPTYSGGDNVNEDYVNFVTLVTRLDQTGNIRFNGAVVTGWLDMGSTGGVAYRYVTLTNVASSSVHTVTSVGGTTFSGRLYGRADRESYAFPIGFGFN